MANPSDFPNINLPEYQMEICAQWKEVNYGFIDTSVKKKKKQSAKKERKELHVTFLD